MLPRNPLEIPEMMDRVALHLEKGDLARGVRVSKGWRDMLLPHLWRNVQARFSRFPRGNIYSIWGPDRDIIYSHRHLIENLYLIGGLNGLEQCHYPNLQKLRFELPFFKDQGDCTTMNFTKTAPLLAHLKMGHMDIGSAFWETLSTHPHIRHLYLREIKTVATQAFWTTCAKLTSLLIVGVAFEEDVPKDRTFDQLCQLTIRSLKKGMEVEDQLDLVLRCPKLESLSWHLNESSRTRGLILVKHPIQKNHWPHLHQLCISGYLQDTDLVSILEGTKSDHGNVVDPGQSSCPLEAHSSKDLRMPFGVLENVDLSMCYLSSSATVLKILCHCPRLKVLHARSVLAKDIAQGGPWVCQQLRELKLYFRVREKEQDLQPFVFERLSTLTQLEVLIMKYPYGGDDYQSLSTDVCQDALVFRLDCGMGRLASLRQLTELHFLDNPPYIPHLDVDEAEWMVDHWKKLKSIRGRLNEDDIVNARIKSILEPHGILIRQ
ncbi:hypothetical protein BGX34_011335 [Mortierella sp. NVP85]|nr:hypothetical protein BGX34_011335 [Mortierella sp. NVP85]